MSFDPPSGAGPGPRWTGDGSLTPRVAVPEDDPASPAHRTVRDAVSVARPTRSRVIATGDLTAVLARPGRRAVAMLIDVALKVLLFSFIMTLSGIESSKLTAEMFAAGQILSRGWDVIFFTQGWTPGARMLGVRIVRLDGSVPGLRYGLVRAAGAALSETALWIGHAWAFRDPRYQTWQDRLAGTVVVEVPRSR
ncbi:MAG: RDD family protein [Dehalococcoidia bacterium]|nr:MAG: RDD family protein [Dehalococcoidia bacterium]